MYLFILFCFKYGKTALDFAESFGRKVSKKNEKWVGEVVIDYSREFKVQNGDDSEN